MTVVLIFSTGWGLAANPAENFLKVLRGVPVEQEIQEVGKTAKYKILKLEKALDLSRVGELPKEPQSSPMVLMQAIAVLLTNLDESKVNIIKSYHTADDVIQKAPSVRIMAIMKKDRKDWTISSIAQSGDFLFLCGHFKDGSTGKVERDVWPMTFASGKWYLVVVNPQFIASGGMAIMEHLSTGSTDF